MGSLINIEDLRGTQRELAEIIGIEKYLEVVKAFGGSSIYIYKLDTALQANRNREICEKFDGGNFRELGQEYNLTERTIREIVSPVMVEVRNRPGEGQLSFY